MKLFVGLGNPGRKYENNRHNVGFMAIDRIAADHGFSPFRSRFQGQVSEGRLGTQKVLLLKPQTFMNRSGQSVGEAMRFYKLDPSDVVVFHDEIDLAPGKCRVKNGGGHAGHNGLRSLHQHIGPHYSRVRIGVGHPGHKDRVAGYVLHDFAAADRDWLDPLLQAISEGAAALAAGDDTGFMNTIGARMNRRGGGQKKAARTAPGPASNAPGPKPEPEPEPQPAPDETEARGPLQRLIDKFR